MSEPFRSVAEGTAMSHLQSAYEIEVARLNLLSLINRNDRSVDPTLTDENRSLRRNLLTLASQLLLVERDTYMHNCMQNWARFQEELAASYKPKEEAENAQE